MHRVPLSLFSTALPADTLRFCVLLKQFGASATVDLLERLPTPFGLVRSGVAPDHADTKNVINQYTATAGDQRLSFFGNVHVGRDVSVDQLRATYNAVVLAYGADSNKRLGIPGEDLRHVLSAREFVQWYNGHPDNASLPIDLSSTTSVAICGLGNVAVDCARVLLRAPDDLAATDIAAHALQQLRGSAVREVHLIGRRGPAHAAFTAKELRELLNLPHVDVRVDQHHFEGLAEAEQASLQGSRARKRVYDLLSAAAGGGQKGGAVNDPNGMDDVSRRTLHLHFYRTPVAIEAAEGGGCGAVVVEATRVETGDDGSARVQGTGVIHRVPAQLVLESIGYRSLPLPGVPFDARRGVVPNRDGRVLSAAEEGASIEPGLYVCGWAKRGPSGIIGTNLTDAQETVAAIAADAQAGLLPQVPAKGLASLLDASGVRYVTFDQWLRLDQYEVQRGQQAGKAREKVVDVPEMLRVCHS